MSNKKPPAWIQQLLPTNESAAKKLIAEAAPLLSSWHTVSKCGGLQKSVIKAMLHMEMVGPRRQAIIINRLIGWLREPLGLKQNQERRLEAWRWLAANGKLVKVNTNDGSMLRQVRKEIAGARRGAVSSTAASRAELLRV